MAAAEGRSRVGGLLRAPVNESDQRADHAMDRICGRRASTTSAPPPSRCGYTKWRSCRRAAHDRTGR
jgi:hypothetical protein